MSNPNFQRNTVQRQVILEELCRLKSHPTASDLHEIVRKRLPKISLGTVYRNLDLLSRGGQVLKLVSESGEARYDGNSENHYHIRCVECGRVDDLSETSDDPLENKCADLNGYELLGYRLEYIGICPGCQNIKKK